MKDAATAMADKVWRRYINKELLEVKKGFIEEVMFQSRVGRGICRVERKNASGRGKNIEQKQR